MLELVPAVCVKEGGGGIPIADAERCCSRHRMKRGRGAVKGAGASPGGWSNMVDCSSS